MATGGDDLKAKFTAYADFGKNDKTKTGRMDSKQATKMLKEANIIDGKKYTSNAFDITFTKTIADRQKKNDPNYSKGVKTINFDGFSDLLDLIAGETKKPSADLKTAVTGLAGPKTEGTTGTANKDTTGRMTDTTKYTGAHKERFDADGKGKGVEGRKDVAANDGYVGAYKEKDTYDKKH